MEVKYLHDVGKEGLDSDDVGEELLLVYVLRLLKLAIVELLPVFREMSDRFISVLFDF